MDLCMYASKPCWNPRFVKTNGELHRFCLFHRAKANASHRRWQSRRELALTLTNPDNCDDGWTQEIASPARKRMSKARMQSAEMWLHRSRVARRHYHQLPADDDLLDQSATYAEADEEHFECVQSLSDEEISILLESIVTGTVDPMNESFFPTSSVL